MHLYAIRRWLCLLTLLWLAAGIDFQESTGWYSYLGGRIYSYLREPIHLISRMALQDESDPFLVGYHTDSWALFWKYYRYNYSQGDYYFRERRLDLETPDSIDQLSDAVHLRAITDTTVWVFYLEENVDEYERNQLDALMRDLHYDLCEESMIGIQTVLLDYSWSTLDCAPPQLLGSFTSDLIDYHFYGAALNSDGSSVVFSDGWTARREIPPKTYSTSVQLVDSDWDKVAQVELPLAHEGKVRRFSIDVSDVVAGQYRLVAILYDRGSGERFSWSNNPGYVPDMLLLAEIEIEE